MKVLMRVILVILLGYGGYRFWVYVNTPAGPRDFNRDLRQVLEGRAARVAPTEAPGEVAYRGKYMSFVYPGTAITLERKNTTPSVLERVDLEIKEPRLTIVAAAMSGTEKRLEDIPGVNMRRQQTDMYKEDQVVVGPEKTSVFSRLDGTEKTLFVIYEGRQYTLSITGNNTSELEKLWNKILPTFHFG